MVRLRMVVMLAAVLSLGACSWFSSDDDEAATPAAEVVRPPVPVASVSNIEIGRTRSGFAITVHGSAQSLGFSKPQLRPRREGRPAADGFLDFDFVAQPPRADLGYGEGTPAARVIRADLMLPADRLQGVLGIRVHGASGGMQILF